MGGPNAARRRAFKSAGREASATLLILSSLQVRDIGGDRLRFGTALALALLLHGCGEWPRDSQGTLDRVRAGAPLRVGYSIAHPWVHGGGYPDGPIGLEPDLIRDWARENRVRIQWVEGGESQLVEALANNELDVAVAGFTTRSPHGARMGTTQPYLKAPIVIGAVRGTPLPEDYDGVEIRYDARRPEFAAAISAIGAVPVPAAPGTLRPIAAVYRPELAVLGLQDTGEQLRTERRVIAAAPSENAIVLSLDRFLHARKRAIERQFGAYSKP